MKHTGLMTSLLAALLMAGSMTTLADRDDRRNPHYGGWNDRDRWEHRSRWQYGDRWRHGDRRHWRGGERYGGRWVHPGARQWRRGWYYAPPPRRFRHYDDRGAGLIGGAIIGSFLTESLRHDRGDHRRCDHGRTTIIAPGACYRIERLPGGRERRVELPASACRW